MLFDLTSTRRRRTTVKFVYGILALLMVVGLVFLGVGTGGSGPLDNDTNGGGSGSAASNGAGAAKISAGTDLIKKTPSSGPGYADLEEGYLAEAQSASNFNETSGLYTKAGLADLTKVVSAWNAYSAVLKGAPNQTAVVLAAYAMDATKDFAPAVLVWQDFIKANPTAPKGYECLAATAYATKNTTLGAEAVKKAIAVTPKLVRTTTQSQLDELKTASYAKEYAAGVCE